MNGISSVLVIEENLELRSLLKRVLEKWGYAVDTVASLKEALLKLKLDPFDVILVNYMISEMSGICAMRTITANKRALIFVVTDYLDAEIEKDVILLGANKLIRNPLNLNDLKMALVGVRPSP